LQEALAVPLEQRDYWGEFCCWNLLYGIFWRQGRAERANDARISAVRAYSEFRNRGGIPPRPATRFLAALLGFVFADSTSGRTADLERYRAWSRENQQALHCEIPDETISAIFAFVTNQLPEEEFLKLGEGLDQACELLQFAGSLGR